MHGRRLALAFLAVLGALVAAAVAARAQAFEPTLAMNATFPTGPLTPLVDHEGFPSLEEVTVRVPLRLEYTVPQGHAAAGPTRIALAATQKPFWLDVAFEGPAAFPTPAGVATEARTYTVVVEALLHAKNTAPTDTPGTLEIAATPMRGPVPAARPALAQTLVVARPYVVFEAEPTDPTPHLVRFGNATVVVRVGNVGNALVAAVVQVAHADPGLEAKPPLRPLLLRPNPLAFQLELGELPVQIRHRDGPGGEVLLLVTTAVREDGWLVKDHAVRLHVDVAEAASPAVGLPLLALLGVAGLAFLSRRA